jgi:RsiW-degrading membrane proteinase PrsW (M82 family)
MHAPAQRTSILQLWFAGLGIFVLMEGIIAISTLGIADAFALRHPAFQKLILAIVVVIPAISWLIIIRYQDRLQPEPRTYVIGLFVIGVALLGGIYDPFMRGVGFVDWHISDTYDTLIRGVVKGAVWAGLCYATLRWTIVPTAEFDQHIDGIVYAVAVMMGVATADGFALLILQDVNELTNVLTLHTIDVAIYVTIGTVVGYCIGLLKPGTSHGRVGVLLVITVAAAMAFNGYLQQVLPMSTPGASIWLRLAPVALVYVSVLCGMSLLLRRIQDRPVTTNTEVSTVGRADGYVLGSVFVLVLFAAIVISLRHQPALVTHGPYSFALPTGMLPVFPKMSYPVQGQNGVRYSIAQRPSTGRHAEDVSREALVDRGECHQYAQQKNPYGTALEYVCLPERIDGSVMHGFTLVTTDRGQTYTLSLTAGEGRAQILRKAWKEVLGSIRAVNE